MRLGAVDTSSFADESEISTIRNVLTLRPTSRGKIIGQDPKIREVLSTIDRVARSTCTVLVTGESGTGKELVVAALHDASDRRNGPLVTINCGAIPVDLVESELFGHTRGAFTGAQNARRGHVAAAEGGTLFLDEIGELPLLVQVKLLRLLQQREYTPLGESRAVKCDVRIVAATHKNLEAEVRAGRFREDLYYRLNVINIHLPALRERRGDVRLLAQHFYRRAAAEAARDDLRGISPAALDAIEMQPWHGNVRALENAIERAVLLARGPYIEPEDIVGRNVRGAVEASAPKTSDPRREATGRPEPIRDALSTGVFERIEIPMAAIPRPLSVPVPPPPAPAPLQTAMPLDVTNVAGGGIRHGSNPNFPRVLPGAGMDLFSAVEQYQNHLIRQALARTGGNKNRAAQLLGLNRTTLVEMIRRRGL